MDDLGTQPLDREGIKQEVNTKGITIPSPLQLCNVLVPGAKEVYTCLALLHPVPSHFGEFARFTELQNAESHVSQRMVREKNIARALANPRWPWRMAADPCKHEAASLVEHCA